MLSLDVRLLAELCLSQSKRLQPGGKHPQPASRCPGSILNIGSPRVPQDNVGLGQRTHDLLTCLWHTNLSSHCHILLPDNSANKIP